MNALSVNKCFNGTLAVVSIKRSTAVRVSWSIISFPSKSLVTIHKIQGGVRAELQNARLLR